MPLKNLLKRNKEKYVFDLIAPIYGLFYNYQKKRYASVFDDIQKELDLTNYKNIIDVGCGTGALCSVLYERGYVVTGVDTAQKMLNIAKNRLDNKAIEFIQASATEKLPFIDKSFDVSIAAYVAHGLKAGERALMYAEMSRITKHLVIIYDYNENRSVLTNVIEWLEAGDYFNFIKIAKLEMQEHFHEVRIIDAGLRAAWYICVPNVENG